MKVHQIRRFSCLSTVKLQLNVPKSHKFGFRDNVSENRRFLVFNLNVLPGDECFSNFAIKCMRIGIFMLCQGMLVFVNYLVKGRESLNKGMYGQGLTKEQNVMWLCYLLIFHYDHILPDVV